MDPNNTVYQPTQEDQMLKRQAMFQLWKDRIYRFFYNIWPAVNRVLSFFFYHTIRIVKGFFKIAFQSIRGG